ncbi:glycosyltransferase family 4 protein [Beijerinckia mobilis]|uniref:glycosyltransferase family 4 protein n=1 Tax=Beijerinckia mobilis TaxID=231434 RepID=UPI000AD7B4A6|nr:glycosyltransferase family 4 protein [Beijerinckia mobilis]
MYVPESLRIDGDEDQSCEGHYMKIMVWPTARGGMRSVVEGYKADGFIEAEDVQLVASYAEGNFLHRQVIFVGALLSFIRLLTLHRVDLVHLHSAMRGSFWRKSILASLARMRGVPVIFHLHGSEMKSFYDEQKPWGQKKIADQLTRAARVVVLSESWRTFVQTIAPAADPLTVPNYVTVPAQPARGTGSPLTLVFLGLIGARKGLYDLLEALAFVRQSYPDIVLLVGGNGEEEKAKECVQALGLDDAVEFKGWVGPAEKAELLDRADIYVLPSYNEGLPMSVLEAMAYGIAVVTSNVGGLPELVEDGVHGRLVQAGDKEGLAAALLELARDPERRRQMGEAGRRRVVEGYSKDVVLPRLSALYETLTNERRDTTRAKIA